MIVMPSNATGWFWVSLALQTGRLGHLYSPGAERGPWPWFPYALDNGAFACWNPKNNNSFDNLKWKRTEVLWMEMLEWTKYKQQKPLWAIVPDRPGDWEETCRKWSEYAGIVVQSGIPLAVAVQDGATPESVRQLTPAPNVIAVGGSTEWKWATVEMWAKEFPRVHLLRCNAPSKFDYLLKLGVESCDGTGLNRGDENQTKGAEEWLIQHQRPIKPHHPLWPHVCKTEKQKQTGLKPVYPEALTPNEEGFSLFPGFKKPPTHQSHE
jgi:hypothetical protein